MADITNVTLQKPSTFRKLLPVVIGVVVLLMVVGMCGLVWLLTIDPARTSNIRDIVIIMFAFVNVIIGVCLAVLVFQVQALIALLRNEIKPLLSDARQTFTTVRGTTQFVSDSVAQPAIKVASFFAGLRGAGKAARDRVNRK